MSIDATGQKSLAQVPALLEKFSVLNKWITAQMEETRQAESRIEQKLGQLGKLEGSLTNMIETLRKQMTETIPVIHQANLARTQAKDAVDSAVKDALAAARAQSSELTQAGDLAKESVDSAVRAALTSVQQHAAYLTHMQSQVKESVDVAVQEALAGARQQANHLAHTAADEIDSQIKERIQTALAGVSVEQMAGISDDVTQRLNDESAHCREQAEQTLILFRQLLQQQVEKVSDQAAAAVRPHVNRISETREQVDREIDAILESSRETVEKRLEMLARSAESSVELIEQTLVGRVKNIRPQVMTEVESTQKLIAHRVAGLVEASKKMVETVVKDLDAKLTDLPEKTEALREELDLRITTYMNELQESATTMVGWLEDRVNQRVDDLVEKSRHSMWGELRALNAATDRLSAAAATAEPIPAQEHPGQPLSLTMYVDRMKPKSDPKPAA